MREICSNCSLSVPKGKWIQRQVRYERLKEEFLRLVRGIMDKSSSAHSTNSSKPEPLSDSERTEFQTKIELYKDQVVKMRQNLDLYKESMQSL